MLRDEAISGKLIIIAVALALLATNTALKTAYEALWHTNLGIGLGRWSLTMDLRHWVNDGLMAIFFLVVGLELKRELIRGELRQFKTAILPFAAAVGGMVVPALIYVLFNMGSETLRGWAIPVATDIAIAVSLLALISKKAPSSIRLFLLTLAIVDDILAVLVIAIFYNTGINMAVLLMIVGLIAVTLLLQKNKFLNLGSFIVIGLLMWVLVNASGVHASIAGAIVGMLAPIRVISRHKSSIAERLERLTIPISTLFVVPLFAFANAGIVLSLTSFKNAAALPIAGGIIVGLVVGKVVGIVGVSWLMVKLGIAQLPSNSNWIHIIGVGMLAGIGFTVSIFVTELAFSDEQFINIAKISIFAASAISALAGLWVLRFMNNKAYSE